jgi:hypothetical protein
MKKLTFAILLLVSIGLLALRDNEVCPGVAGHKALACSACHGGSISGEVFIIDGKVQEDNPEDNSFEFIVRVPSGSLGLLQLFSSSADQVYGAPRVEVDLSTALLEVKGSTLYGAVNLSKDKSVNNTKEFTIRYSFVEPLTMSTKMILQGVISNNDGTKEGDQTFYKEITIEPKKEDLQASNLSLVYDQAYYHNNQVVISNPGKTQAIQIIDLEGKVVHSAIVEECENIDVSQLVQGMYLVLVGNHKNNLQTFKFVK